MNAERVIRHEGEHDWWELALRAPDPRLRGYVYGYCRYDERTMGPQRRRELPSRRVTLIVNTGAPIRVAEHGSTDSWGEQPVGFVTGLWDSYATTETPGSQRGVQVDLAPVGAHLLLGVPMHELTNRVVTLDELLGSAGLLLRKRAAEDPFDAVDAFLLERLDEALSPVPTVTRALSRLHETAGGIRIGELAREIGCSRRHLTGRFEEQVGVSPKLFARILRFEQATSLLGSVDDPARVAHECGYFDQSHLIRDFKQFAGCGPTELRERTLADSGGVTDHA